MQSGGAEGVEKVPQVLVLGTSNFRMGRIEEEATAKEEVEEEEVEEESNGDDRYLIIPSFNKGKWDGCVKRPCGIGMWTLVSGEALAQDRAVSRRDLSRQVCCGSCRALSGVCEVGTF